MKVKLLKLLALGGQITAKGMVIDVLPAEGKALVKKGYAVEVESPEGQTSDQAPSADETKVEVTQLGTTLKDLGGGWYLLPNGDPVQGKEEATAALQALEPTINQ